MEKYSDLIEDIRNLHSVNPPDALVVQVMARVEKDNQNAGVNIRRFFPRSKTTNPDAPGTFSDRITSYEQCAFLLFMVGFFYLVAGVVALWGFHDVIKEENINTWLKIQPYITIANALFLISAAFVILYRPQVTTFVQYAMIIHAILILVNAYILQSIISFPVALVFVLILTIMAIAFAVLLIGSIRSVLRYGAIY
ncbi:MAG: hypothetical protein CVU51_01415 [Deltaproteobacteria bacterium HGW-Deltaproteobacteria-1]|jgi:hypothetical protein|nr:MAG: hypothetical protein CVU51_01415 [Deltaproteobacteria bacterium HGW-Deltaproteobacteria-1]